MKNRKKEAKFFCESCGSEVPRKAKTCPMCGKFFASVRCPQCGRTGETEEFRNGCPTCGYAVHPELYGGRNTGNIKLKNSKRYASDSGYFNKSKKKSGYVDSSLPWWIYLVSILLLVFLVIYLYSCL